MAKSSIHVQAGNINYFSHNDRTTPTVNSIFFDEENYYSLTSENAIILYTEELKKRTMAYTKRTKQKLQKSTITHLSAIINLNKNHDKKDLELIVNYLEFTLDTKVIQFCIHRDEGVNNNDVTRKNYHGHIEFMGLDSNGSSIRRKLDKKYLHNLQSNGAILLNMVRGEIHSRKKRLDTYEYKQAMEYKDQAEKVKTNEINHIKNEYCRLDNKVEYLNSKNDIYFINSINDKDDIYSKDIAIYNAISQQKIDIKNIKKQKEEQERKEFKLFEQDLIIKRLQENINKLNKEQSEIIEYNTIIVNNLEDEILNERDNSNIDIKNLELKIYTLQNKNQQLLDTNNKFLQDQSSLVMKRHGLEILEDKLILYKKSIEDYKVKIQLLQNKNKQLVDTNNILLQSNSSSMIKQNKKVEILEDNPIDWGTPSM